jgi:hypothetical protein
LNTSNYLLLYSPALDWIVQCLLHKLGANKTEQMIDKTRSALGMPRSVNRANFFAETRSV